MNSLPVAPEEIIEVLDLVDIFLRRNTGVLPAAEQRPSTNLISAVGSLRRNIQNNGLSTPMQAVLESTTEPIEREMARLFTAALLGNPEFIVSLNNKQDNSLRIAQFVIELANNITRMTQATEDTHVDL